VSTETPIQRITIEGQYYVLMSFDTYQALEIAAKALSSSFTQPRPIDEISNGTISPKVGESALRLWRKRRKMTVRQLADASNMKVGMLYQVEKNLRRGNIKSWRALAEVLGVTIQDILPES
jgi:DNA-binding XRE family transcriptional regulator